MRQEVQNAFDAIGTPCEDAAIWGMTLDHYIEFFRIWADGEHTNRADRRHNKRNKCKCARCTEDRKFMANLPPARTTIDHKYLDTCIAEIPCDVCDGDIKANSDYDFPPHVQPDQDNFGVYRVVCGACVADYHGYEVISSG